MLEAFGMENSKPVSTAGSIAKPNFVPQPLNASDHKRYRAIVGKLFWHALI
jgi:hypothetical protein